MDGQQSLVEELLGWKHPVNMSSLGQQSMLRAAAQFEEFCRGHAVLTVLLCLG